MVSCRLLAFGLLHSVIHFILSDEECLRRDSFRRAKFLLERRSRGELDSCIDQTNQHNSPAGKLEVKPQVVPRPHFMPHSWQHQQRQRKLLRRSAAKCALSLTRSLTSSVLQYAIWTVTYLAGKEAKLATGHATLLLKSNSRKGGLSLGCGSFLGDFAPRLRLLNLLCYVTICIVAVRDRADLKH